MDMYTCCFIGHKRITETKDLQEKLTHAIETLIVTEKVDTFLFGSKSRFDRLCLQTVTGLKEKYPHIQRIYVRAEFPVIDRDYRSYLLESYEDTYYPEKILDAGRAVYVERNYEMIRRSHFCIFYFDASAAPTTRKSGAKIALDYARKQKKQVLLFP